MKYRMPAEWEPHEGTWIAWPHNQNHWPGKFDPIPGVFADIIAALAASERVFLLVNDDGMEVEAHRVLQGKGIDLARVEFFKIPTDTSWTRDFGPIFVRDDTGKLIATDWIFNSWGGKYAPWDQDDIVPVRIAEQLKFPFVTPGIILEGGSIEVNGKGTLITTEQCLLNQNRNKQLSRIQIESYLKQYLGATNILWLKEGIIGDDTDGHIDDLAKFIDIQTIVCPLQQDTDDENHQILKKNYEDLCAMKDQEGMPFNIVTIPMPKPVYYKRRRLPASYINFYIANSAVLVPTFRCAEDHEVLKILQGLFTDRKVIGVDCTDLIWGLGAIHCSTQQQPVA